MYLIRLTERFSIRWGGSGGNREMAAGLYHTASALGAGLHAADAGDLEAPGATQSDLAAGFSGNHQRCHCRTRDTQTAAKQHHDSEAKDKRMGN